MWKIMEYTKIYRNKSGVDRIVFHKHYYLDPLISGQNNINIRQL